MGLLGRLFRTLGGHLNESSASGEKVLVRYRKYTDRIDLTGRDLISVVGRTRAEARLLFPSLAERVDMEERELPVEQVTATMIGQVADEVHEFRHAVQRGTRVRRLLLRNGEVIELLMG